MSEVIVYLLVALVAAAVVALLIYSAYSASRQKRIIDDMRDQVRADNMRTFDELLRTLKEYHKENKDDYERAQSSQREEIANANKAQREAMVNAQNAQREELAGRIKEFNDSFSQGVKLLTDNQKAQMEGLQRVQEERLKSLETMQAERLQSLDKTQAAMVQSTEKRLEDMRKTVEEKLDKTLSDRISKSFETVGTQLNAVQKGLGEMKSLASDVGGLKKVLSNVKLRGGVGEVQLRMLLEQYLAPAQFEANVHTVKGSSEQVEFAVKFPGPDGHVVWLPIDSKFPQDKYEQLVNAYESADKEQIEKSRKELAAAIRNNAKDIRNKYIEVPYTTKFGIMFLPFEGLYAEIARDGMLIEQLQREYSVTVAGPTNLAAILTSFQLGFQTLTIQKRGDEVWSILGAVKTEFEKFGGMLEKAKGKIEGGLKDLDTVMTTRTNVINRKLKNVSTLDATEAEQLLNE